MTLVGSSILGLLVASLSAAPAQAQIPDDVWLDDYFNQTSTSISCPAPFANGTTTAIDAPTAIDCTVTVQNPWHIVANVAVTDNGDILEVFEVPALSTGTTTETLSVGVGSHTLATSIPAPNGTDETKAYSFETTAGPSYIQPAPMPMPDSVASLPETMTVEQMDAIPSDGIIELATPDDPAPADAAGASVMSVPIAVTGDFCRLEPAIMWSRTSGSGYRYGTIGSKPKLYSCTLGVRKTGISSDVWQFNGWFWFKASGPFNSYGTGNMEQKSVQQICTGTRIYAYKVITTAWGTNSRGQTGVGRDSTPEKRFNCG